VRGSGRVRLVQPPDSPAGCAGAEVARVTTAWRRRVAHDMLSARADIRTSPTEVFADGQENNGVKKRTVNRPAEVAMGRKSSYTARPDGNAARHTDARSLAIPVPRGTMIPTATPPGTALTAAASSQPSARETRNRLRRTIARVYASRRRPRTFFQHLQNHARPMPKAGIFPSTRRWRLIYGVEGEPEVRVHGKIDRVEWQNGGGRGGR